jgi:hypothetical protein
MEMMRSFSIQRRLILAPSTLDIRLDFDISSTEIIVMNVPQIRSLVANIAASVDLHESTGSEEFLVDAREDTTRLARALENPRDAIVKLFFAVIMSLPLEKISL